MIKSPRKRVADLVGEKQGNKCQCKFECKLKHLLESGYECDICTYALFVLMVLWASQPIGVMSNTVSLPNLTFIGQA